MCSSPFLSVAWRRGLRDCLPSLQMTQCRKERENIQKDTDRLKQWIDMNVLCLSNSLCKRDLEVLANHKLNISHKYDAAVGKINGALGAFTGPESRS